MSVRREGVPGERTPDGILTRLKGTRVGEIVKSIESRPDPPTINLGLSLLTLGENTAVNLSNLVDRMARQSDIDGHHHDLSLPMGEIGEGLTVHCNNHPVAIAAPKLEKRHCLLRKYKGKVARWYGICITPDASLRFGLNLDFAWEYDQEMEKILSVLPRSGFPVDIRNPNGPRPKIRRNEACPCGSGRKYKKCCLF